MKNKRLPIIWKVLQSFLYGCFLVLANFSISQAEPDMQQLNLSDVYIEVPFDEGTVQQLFTEIEKQSEFTFVHGELQLNSFGRIKVSPRKISVHHVLLEISKETGLQFFRVNSNISVNKKLKTKKDNKNDKIEDVVFNAEIITGRVTSSEDNEPLPGVNIFIKGTNIGTVTDVNGEYRIEVPSPESILVFRFVGYLSEEVKVGDNKMVDVILIQDIQSLMEVVVTALGIEKEERSLSYNVQQIDNHEIATVKDANFINSLAGKVAGATINSSSTGVGGSTRVVLRGTKSINGNNNALYVVNGIPLPALQSEQPGDIFSGAGQTGDGIANFNPEDIESITVLSGPAAAALYGSEAANGVIMITTKKGQKEGLSVNLSNNTTFFSPFVMPRFQNTYGLSELGGYYSWGDKMENPSSYKPADFFQTGYNTTNSISISTGNENNQTYLSIGSVNAEGIINNNGFDRYNFSLRNTSTLLEDKLTMDLSFMYMNTQEKNMLSQGQYFNPLVPIYLFPPGEDINRYMAFERFNATRNFQTQFWPYGDQGFQMQNPFWITERNLFTNKKNRFLMNGALKYKINDWMNVVGRVQMDQNTALNERKLYASTAGLFASDAGAYFRDDISNRQIYADALLNIEKDINDFSISSNIGASFRDTKYEFASLGGNLMGVPNLFAFQNMNKLQVEALQNGYQDQTQSVFATMQAGYKNMVFLDVTARNDWASALSGTNSNSYLYPSVGLSGVVSDIFNIESGILSYLKTRVSYSEVGNAPPRYIGNPTYQVYEGYPQMNTWTSFQGFEPERTSSYEAGINAILWERLHIDFTAYKSSTFNQLFQPTITTTSGDGTVYINAGQIDNKGIELSLRYKQDLGRNVHWTSNLVYSLNRNKIVQLLPPFTMPGTGQVVSLDSLDMGGTGSYKMILTEGGMMGDIYVNTLRRDEHGNIWVNTATQSVSPDNDRYIKAGNANPLYTIGFGNRFTYKNFDASFLINARVGGEVVSVTQAIMDGYGVSEASAKARDNGGVLINGFNSPAEAFYRTVGGGTSGIGSMYVYSATNVRLAEMSLGYTVPLADNSFIKSVNLSLVGRNLFMFYNKAPFDPELTANTGTYYQGVDYFMQPSLRSFGFAIRAGF